MIRMVHDGTHEHTHNKTLTEHGYLMGMGMYKQSWDNILETKKLGGTKKTYTIQYTFPSNQHASKE